MNIIIVLIIILGTSVGLAKEYIVKIGEPLLLAKSGHSLWVEKKELFKIEDLGSQIKILSGKSGSSDFIFGDSKTLTIHSLSKNNWELHKELTKIISQIVGLELKINNGIIHISGRLYQFSDYKKIVTLALKKQAHFVLNASYNLEIKKDIQNYILKFMNAKNLRVLKLSFQDSISLFLNTQQPQIENYLKYLPQVGVQVVVHENNLKNLPSVHVQITIAELRKDLKQQWGLEWPSQLSSQLIGGQLINQTDILFNAKAFENSGYGKVLASPSLVSRSGNEAEFWAGGEFPIKIFNAKIQDVVWKKYGIILKVKPSADSQGRMHIQLETEISNIDNSQSVDGIPALTTDRVSSTFDLEDEKIITLSGLIKNQEGFSKQGLLGISQIPFLSPLFSSQDFKDNKTELVIFVRPQILKEDNNPRSEHLTQF